ncbi:MAG: 1-deoxy-D-xylulose-5-phosphate synthase [Bacteroidales bacterium]|nr:1-deoxy-D-xylulose-5-phosphate synthase [Bacteroidales bacterium]MCF8388678.1 1-deoxy-D-xylulose-5-phosphate synthase [Bacteroidales bacterium]MCF8399697.1 1-deoxy-D-xylulose-5-phosphate synthase [Bacteroidales bacterium]
MTPLQGKLLENIDYPSELKKLKEKQLPELCKELREFILDVTSSNPGHVGASLGAVELAVALHYIFNTPNDKVIWDVGHQAYAHKILTGRKSVFQNLRKYKGISGFPRMSESEYDAFGTGHSSTSISAALGMAIASKMKNDDRQHVAVIGDGSMTGGMALEGLNNAGVSNTNLLVILNDNGIAIDKSTGALKEYLIQIQTSRTYNRIKNLTWKLLGKASKYGPNSQRIVQQIENAIKGSLLKKSNLFESFNFRYFGPVDGNDVVRLTKVLRDLKDIQGPKILHVMTVKGKGLKEAELHQTTYHSPGTFDRKTGKIIDEKCPGKIPPKWQHVFGKTIIELAERNEKIIGITPAMLSGSSLNMMLQKMPHRVFDVGIAEQHAVTFAAGLAAAGMKPFCNIYSTFMQRAFDQVIHDVALQKLDVVFCLDRGGLVGEDGATHHGAFDMAYFRSIPNMIVSAPMNESELRSMMYTAQLTGMGPFSIRYPKGRGFLPNWKTPMQEIGIGKARKLKDGKDAVILSIGHVGNFALEACEALAKDNVDVALYDMRFVKPMDKKVLRNVFDNFNYVLTVEDGSLQAGFGSAVLEFMEDHHYQAKVKRLGIPDAYIEQGSLEELYKECGYDTEGIILAVKSLIES